MKQHRLNGHRTFRVIYEFVKWTGLLPALLVLRPKVTWLDREGVKQLNGAFLLSSNHRTMIDPIIISTVFPKLHLYYLAQEQLFENRPKSWLFSQFGCVKIDRTNIDMQTFRTIGDILKSGKPLAIFPEGAVQTDGKSVDFKSGVGMIALTNNVPILPMHIRKRESIFHRYRIAVGTPIFLNDIIGTDRSLVAIEKLTEHIYSQAQLLKDLNEKGDRT